jgi:hypothetical protein
VVWVRHDPTGKADTYFGAKTDAVGAMQQLLKDHLPLGYILENAPMQFNQRHPRVSLVHFPRICKELGTPVLLDAARVGSRAHRLRNYWTNLADANALQVVIDSVQRPPGLLAADILEEGVTIPRVAPHDDFFPLATHAIKRVNLSLLSPHSLLTSFPMPTNQGPLAQ